MSNLLIQNQGICIIIVFANIDNSWIGSSTIHKCPPMLPNIRKTLNRKLNLVKQKIKLKNKSLKPKFQIQTKLQIRKFPLVSDVKRKVCHYKYNYSNTKQLKYFHNVIH